MATLLAATALFACGPDDSGDGNNGNNGADAGTDTSTNGDTGADSGGDDTSSADTGGGVTPTCGTVIAEICAAASECGDSSGTFKVSQNGVASFEYESLSQCEMFEPINEGKCENATSTQRQGCIDSLEQISCSENVFQIDDTCVQIDEQ
jgi:hypothetical protein